ncbi:MAG: phenylalanine--tRNA ligase subunit beta [Patescibacteria group bacterium]
MKISRNWLKNYFDKPIPDANKLAEFFTFHSFEVEGVEEIGNESPAVSLLVETALPRSLCSSEDCSRPSDTASIADFIIDVKVLPDRAHYCLSHKGIAGEVSVLTGQAIKDLKIPDMLEATTEVGPMYKPSIIIQDRKFCRRYMGRYVENITVNQSLEWMKRLLEAIGQRSISGIVDATNFCMFDIGQPLHAFDADKIKGVIVVRPAKASEKMILLDGTEITLTTDDSVIADDAGPLAIAGVKGGKRAEVTSSTKRIFMESANFNPTAVRRTSTKYNLRSESSKRYENEITPELVSLGMNNICALIKEMNPEAKFGPIVDVYPVKAKQTVIDFDPAYIEKRLGVKFPFDEAKSILERMGIIIKGGDTSRWKLTIPFDRLDLTIREDIVEEIGRVYGYEHIKGILPPKTNMPVEILPAYYLSEKIKDILIEQGFSEVSLYTLVEKGDIETAKPLARDKAFARKNLVDSTMTCVEKNALNADLLGLQTIKVFEIGKVFSKEGERLVLSLGVAQVKKIKGVKNESILVDALKTLKENISLFGNETKDSVVDIIDNPKIITKGNHAVCEIDLEEILKSIKLPAGASYKDLNFMPSSSNHYEKISLYPFIVRDIAVFVPESIQALNVWESIKKGIGATNAKELLVRHSLFDTFKKEGKVSYAFRLVFQSLERTLTDEEANAIMEKIYEVMKDKEWEVR